MPTLNTLNSTINNVNLNSSWINNEINGKGLSPFSEKNRGNSSGIQVPLSPLSCCTYAPFPYKGGSSNYGVCFKSYDSSFVWIYDEYSTRYINGKTNTRIIYYIFGDSFAAPDGVSEGAVLVGKNNEISICDFVNRTNTTKIGADTFFNDTKGCVLCNYKDEDYSEIGMCLWAIYKDANNKVACVSPQNGTEWRGANSKTFTSSYTLNADEVIMGTPFYDHQTSKFYIITKKTSTKRFRILEGQINMTASTLTVTSIIDIATNLFNIVDDIQLSTFYSKTDYTPCCIINVSYGGELHWCKLMFEKRMSLMYEATQPWFDLGNSSFLIYNAKRYKGYQYPVGGIIVTIGTTDLKEYQSGIASLPYFMYNEYFNNEDMIQISCHQGDKLYLLAENGGEEPLWIFKKISPTSTYYDLEKILVRDEIIPIGFTYSAREDCIIFCNRHQLFKVDFATSSN